MLIVMCGFFPSLLVVCRYAVLNEQVFQKMSSNLNNMIQLVCFSFMTNLYACESYKTQVSFGLH